MTTTHNTAHRTTHTRTLQHVLLAGGAVLALAGAARGTTARDAMGEADALQALAARESGRPAYSPATAVRFKASDHVFVKSALAVNFTYRAAFVTLPLFRGLGPKGEPVYYIVTDASDFDMARKMGINYAPKMRHAAGDGAQRVTLDGGVMRFRGAVDFTPEHLGRRGAARRALPAAGGAGRRRGRRRVVLDGSAAERRRAQRAARPQRVGHARPRQVD
jgi:hypothetical protein